MVLGFSCSGSADRNYPAIGPGEERVLERFVELYRARGNILEALLRAARRKLDFSEESVRYWAPRLVDGRLGPLDPLLEDDLEEVMVNGLGQPVFIYDRRRGMQRTNLAVESESYFMELANRMLAPLGRRVNRTNPRETGVLESGDRLSVAVPPYSRGFTASIRKFTAEPFTVPQLVERGMLSWEAAAFLWMVVETGNVNVGVVGNTGSGKTTLLNALMRMVPARSRLVVVEDVPEIQPLQDQVVGLLSNRPLGLSMRDAILDSLRMRPDRVVIGEVRRDGEVRALRESCLAGHAMGTYFTYHSESIRWAYRRLENQGFPRYDLPSIGLLVACRRYESGGSITREVVEVGNRELVFRRRGGELERVGDFASEYLELAFGDVWEELGKRADFLRGCGDMGDVEFFREVQGWSPDL